MGHPPTYKKWFGKANSDQIEHQFAQTLDGLLLKTVNWRVDFTCGEDVGAWVKLGEGLTSSAVTVHLCRPKFFNLAPWPTKSRSTYFSQAGAILHEFTHLMAITNDDANRNHDPISDAQAMAKNNPGATIHSAYNFQFFAEEIGRNGP